MRNSQEARLCRKMPCKGIDNQVDTMTRRPVDALHPAQLRSAARQHQRLLPPGSAAVYNTYLGVGASETFAVSPAVDNDVLVVTLARDGSAPSARPQRLLDQ